MKKRKCKSKLHWGSILTPVILAINKKTNNKWWWGSRAGKGTFFFFLTVLGLELRAYTLSHSTSSFCVRFFPDRVLWTISPGWFQTSILLISASWGVSHWCQAKRTLYTLLVGMWIIPATMEISMAVPQKLKNTTTIWSCYSTLGNTPGCWVSMQQIHLHICVYSQ
jgi:hypothetical protein